MAAFSIDPGVIDSTLSNHIAGVNINEFCFQDMGNSVYRSILVDLNPEVIRTTELNKNTSHPSFGFYRDCLAYLQGQLGSNFGVVLNTTAMPNPVSQGTSATSITASIDTHAGFAPADHAALYDDWVINHGINIVGWEWSNEPENMTFGLGSVPWYDPAVWTPATAQAMAVDWCNIRHRNISATYATKIAALGRTGTTKIIGSEEFANAAGAGWQYVKSFLLGTMNSGGANPNGSPSNIPYIDTLGFHSYGGGFDPNYNGQGQVNSYFYDSGGSEAAWLAETGDPAKAGSSKSKFKSGCRIARGILDANGGSNVTQMIGEVSGGLPYNKPSFPTTTADIAHAIAFCQVAGAYKLDTYMSWSMNRSGDVENFILAIDDNNYNYTTVAQYQPGRRFYLHRDMIFNYMRTCKRQVRVTVNTPAGNTPPSVSNNSVPRIQIVAGLNSDGSRMYVMLVNADLLNAEQATINLGGIAQGAITGVRCPSNQGSTSLPSIAPFGSGVSSFTTGQGGAPTIATGDAYLFIVPLAPGQPPPPPSGASHTGNWTTVVQINAGGITPPPSLDQHLGNWSTATQLTIRTSSRTVGAGHNTGISRTIGGVRVPGVGGGGG